MNLHEYQGKSILKKYGVAVPLGFIAESPEQARELAKKILDETGMDKFAVKAQIHAGGRGKGGGVKIAKSLDEVQLFADQILGMQLVTPQT
ncbi:MAG: succinate--CoA ligase subunit beta, partial [Bacteroidetes bacterium]